MKTMSYDLPNLSHINVSTLLSDIFAREPRSLVQIAVGSGGMGYQLIVETAEDVHLEVLRSDWQLKPYFR